MSGYGMDDTDLVYNQGSVIHGMGDEAFTTANNAIRAIGEAGGIVHHPVVSGALEGFYSDHCQDAHSLMYSVQDCGSKVGTTSNIVVSNENESLAVQMGYVSHGDGTRSALDRRIKSWRPARAQHGLWPRTTRCGATVMPEVQNEVRRSRALAYYSSTVGAIAV